MFTVVLGSLVLLRDPIVQRNVHPPKLFGLVGSNMGRLTNYPFPGLLVSLYFPMGNGYTRVVGDCTPGGFCFNWLVFPKEVDPKVDTTPR